MAFKEVSGMTRFPLSKNNDPTEGDVLVEGTYTGQAYSEKYKNYQSEFKDQDGRVIIGGGSLSYLLTDIVPGTLCRVTYKGMEKLSSGPFKGKDSHSFTLAVEENTEVAPAPKASAKPEPQVESKMVEAPKPGVAQAAIDNMEDITL